MPRLTVRERLAPEITASLFANYRNAVDALLELIDNAVDSRMSGVGLSIDLTVRAGTVQIVTVGGEGMGPREVERNYLRWGASGKRGRNLLGQYGQGGKAAIGYLGARLSVEVSRPGDEIAWRLDDDEYRDRSRLKTYELREVGKRVDAGLGLVRIRIGAVDRRVDVTRAVGRVRETYRPLLEGGQVHLNVNGQRLEPLSIPTVERRDFRVRAGGGTLVGWTGELAPGAVGVEAGVRCYRLGRLIAGAEWFGHPGPAQSPGLARLTGEVEVPRVPLTMNKTDFDRGDATWRPVEARMHRVLAPLVRRLSHDEQPAPPETALKAAEQVRRLLGQALRLMERNELFEGFEPGPGSRRGRAAAGGDAAGEQGELDMGSGCAEGGESGDGEEPRDERPPRVPPEPRRPARQDEALRRGVGRIELRALGDPAIRSLTVEEGGSTVVVINTLHPLFRERKGDLWYQLETAAREVTARVDGIGLAEYEEQVNRLLLLALGIRSRRRAARTPQPELRLDG